VSVFALPLLVIGFITSLLPFMYPQSLLEIPGVHLNLVLGDLLAGIVPAASGILVEASDASYGLTLAGVFAIYGPVLMLLLAVVRGR
jgi:hypothetical protein